MIGIYKITSPTNKIYIGQSIDLELRQEDYKLNRCKNQTYLYNSLKKYGFNKHKFEIIEECPVEQLNERERYWQDHYNVLGKLGLNCRLTSTTDKSGKMSKESSEKKSIKMSYPILQYDLEGNFIKEWKGAQQVLKEIKIHNVNQVLKGNKISAGNYYWVYKYTDDFQIKIEMPKSRLSRKIKQYDIDGNFIKEWDQIKDAENIFGDLSSVLRKVSKTAYGFKWEYSDDNPKRDKIEKPYKEKIIKPKEFRSRYKGPKIIAYDLSGKEVGIFDNLKQINQTLFNDKKKNLGEITLNCKHKYKSIFGYIFQFENDNRISDILNSLNENKRIKQQEILQYDLEGNFIKKHDNSYQAEKYYSEQGKKINSSDIRSCCNGKQKTSGGFKWKYGESFIDKNSSNKAKYIFKKYLEDLNIIKIIEDYNNEIDFYIPYLNLGFNIIDLKKYTYPKLHHKKLFSKYKNEIKLTQIYSDEIINKEDIVLSRLKNILNITPQKIYARKCEIREITDTKLKSQFLRSNHIQGEDRSKIKLGLFYNDELVSLMTFNHPRLITSTTESIQKYNKESVWELLRFCNKLNTNVIGGASKLLKHFIKEYNPKYIYSFADLRWSSPIKNVYSSLGFQYGTESKQGYFYTKEGDIRLHRFSFRKDELIKKGWGVKEETEILIMNREGYTQIWDCGTLRYDLFI